MSCRGAIVSVLAALAIVVGRRDAVARPDTSPAAGTRYKATAYSDSGKTAQGTYTHEGIVAADPDLLPLGTRIRVRNAGKYDGEYVVRDTGRKINGREIDLYLPSDAEAKHFGRKSVHVDVVKYGDNRRLKQ